MIPAILRHTRCPLLGLLAVGLACLGITGCVSPRLPAPALTLLTAPNGGVIHCVLYDDLQFASDPTGATPIWEGDSLPDALEAAARIAKKEGRTDVTWRDLPGTDYRLPDGPSIERVKADFAQRGLELSAVSTARV